MKVVPLGLQMDLVDPIRLDMIQIYLKDPWSRIEFKNWIRLFFQIGFGFSKFESDPIRRDFWINLNLEINDLI